MSGVISVAVGVTATLLAGLLASGEEKQRRHAAMLSKAAHRAGLTDGPEVLERALFAEKEFTTAALKDIETAIAIGGVAYDVSAAQSIYGESGWYGYLRGKDATRVFATGTRVGYSFEDGLTPGQDPADTEGLDDEQFAHICFYVKLFATKYPKMGVVSDGRFYTGATPTPARAELEQKCATVSAVSHMDESDAMFADVEDSAQYTTKSKCPVVKTTMIVKAAAKVVMDEMTKLIAY